MGKVEVLVLDEADMMFDMGFLPVIRKILLKLPKQRQTLLFSATMPDEIRKLAEDMLLDPVTVQVDKVKPASTVRHALYPIAQHLKTPLLMDLLDKHNEGSILVFTRTKHRAKRVGEQLQKAGHHAASIQGNLSQNRRQEAMDGFRDGTYRILVATDIAARGIDVSLVSLVVNYDVPETPDMYIHRIGRTGRAERSGEAVTFVTGEDTAMVKAVERMLGKPIERKTLQDFDYSIPAPKKDEEFKRPPREQQQRRNTGTAKKGATQGTAVMQPGATKEKAPGRPQQQHGQPKFTARPAKQVDRSRQGR
jgi:ATP-dependent RNA helicase RhlE